MIGEIEILSGVERKETYVALTEVYMMQYEKKVFQKILSEFPQIIREMHTNAKDRNKIHSNLK